jgi:hypothetical protein
MAGKGGFRLSAVSHCLAVLEWLRACPPAAARDNISALSLDGNLVKSLINRLLVGLAVLALTSCGGGGGGGGGGSPSAKVTVSGRITFDRVPFALLPATGLDYGQTAEVPARRVVVVALNSSASVLATTATDDNGDYSLQVPANTNVRIRAKAQSVVTGTQAAPASWNVSVLDNTNGNALYVLDGSLSNTGSTAEVRNLRATSGWGGTSYTSTRAAAPFAVLDTMYSAVRFVIDQGNYNEALPALNVYWSTRNTSSTDFAPASGHIQTTGYQVFSNGVGNGIYVLGDASLGVASDTDEYDQHVLAHEFQHYIEYNLSRGDSWGGDHSLSDRLDLRMAFSEGFADAFSGMVLGDPVYRDSYGTGQSQDTHFDMESAKPADYAAVPGWFNELSVSSIVWDLFDTAVDGVDTGSVGYAPMLDVFRNELTNDVPLDSIFAFASALKQRAGVDATLVTTLVNQQQIVGGTISPYALSETHDGGLPDVLPVYAQVALNGPQVQVCGTADAGTGDMLGNRRLLRFHMPASGPVHILVQWVPDGDTQTADPDLYIWQAGLFDYSETSDPNVETYDNTAMPAGDYVLEVFEYSHVDPNATPRGRTCMLVSATG